MVIIKSLLFLHCVSSAQKPLGLKLIYTSLTVFTIMQLVVNTRHLLTIACFIENDLLNEGALAHKAFTPSSQKQKSQRNCWPR